MKRRAFNVLASVSLAAILSIAVFIFLQLVYFVCFFRFPLPGDPSASLGPYVAVVVIPTTLASSLLILRVWVRCRRLHRGEAGECVRCGYDLRATPERCPECGTAPAKPV